MITIVCGSDIEYTKGDTFRLGITTDDGFDENSQLDFIVSENEDSAPVINKTFSLSGDSFEIELTVEDTGKLVYGDYIYKLVIHTPTGEIITQMSGNFKVKWGA